MEKKTAQDKERDVCSSSGGEGIEVFRPAFTSDMSVLLLRCLGTQDGGVCY